MLNDNENPNNIDTVDNTIRKMEERKNKYVAINFYSIIFSCLLSGFSVGAVLEDSNSLIGRLAGISQIIPITSYCWANKKIHETRIKLLDLYTVD